MDKLSRDIGKIKEFFGVDCEIVFEEKFSSIRDMEYFERALERWGESDWEKNLIRVSPRIGYKNKLKTIVHEMIHLAWGMDHCKKLGYTSRNEDYLSDAIFKVIFPRYRTKTGWLHKREIKK